MAEEKVIKSGVLTIPRLLFLAVVGLIIALTVWRGGIWLTIGYWLMSLGLSGLLLLIAIDYGIDKAKLRLGPAPEQVDATAPSTAAQDVERASAAAPRVRRRTSRPTKRRR
ncbi:MAG TPA: hypothetical protein VKA70_03190 [Blastocatellia bacterium]|nr:hypothetical protein [Blastocatellia bacterium]